MDKPLKYRELRQTLSRHGVLENASRGRGSPHKFCTVVDGTMQRYPARCHNEGDELSAAIIKAVRRRFRLTKEDGVADEAFYR